LRDLGKILTIKALILNGTRVTDEGLQHIEALPLEYLYLGETAISDAGLTILKRITSLKEVSLRNARASAGGIRDLKRALRATTIIGP
jgi:hypothetical protein